MRLSALHLLIGLILVGSHQVLLSQHRIKANRGTKIDLRLLTVVDATRVKPGDTVKLETVWPIRFGQQQKIPPQSEAFGRVVSVYVPSGKKGQAELTLVVERIVYKEFEIRLNAYPIRLLHKIEKIREVESNSYPFTPTEVTVSGAGPPAGSGEGNVVITRQSATPVSEPSPPFGAPGVTPRMEPMPSIKRVKQPPSTKLKERRNVLISPGTIVVVQEF